MKDPWEDVEEGIQFVPDYFYEGDHEVIEDLVEMHAVVVDFQLWADDFRAHDVLHGTIPASQWEQRSPFSETKSIWLASQEGHHD